MILDEICTKKLDEVIRSQIEVPQAVLQDQLTQAPAPLDFREVLRQEGISLVAEIKRASPSRGLMMDGIDPVQLASIYEQSGARAVSVLTDEPFFKGTLHDLLSVARGIDVPTLRKDFIINEYQIYEARAHHADALLLIVRILSDDQLKDYRELAESLGMSVLVESHNEGEIERALGSGAHIIGINNRDLSDFSVDAYRTLELRKYVPGGNVLVSESGIHSRDDVMRLENGGVDAILVGESLVTADDIGGKIRELLGTDAD